MRPTRAHPWPTVLTLAALTALGACGGGSDDTGAAPPSPVTTTPGPAPVAGLSVGGTAAVGARLAGRPVEVRCATGAASGTTAGDGSYTLSVPGGTWPCAVRVTPASGSVLHSVAAGSGAAAIANVTPASQLIVAALAGTDPAAWFGGFADHAAAVTPAAVAAAQAQIVGLLRAAGVDLSGVGDLIAVSYAAVYDAQLDALAGLLTRSGTTLDGLTTRVVAAAAPAAVTLPANLLLQPAAANCSALRTGNYRLLMPLPAATLVQQTPVIAIDARTLSVTLPDGSSATWTANGNCRYTEQHGSYVGDIVVSQAGVLAGRTTTDGLTYRAFIGFPEQAHTLAELAGDWNVLGLTRPSSSTTYVGVAGGLSFDAAGRLTAASNCQNSATWAVDVCATVPATSLAAASPLTADGAGGFDANDVNTGAVASRFFGFAPGSGDLMLASVSNKGEPYFYAPVRSAPLGTLGNTYKNLNLDLTPTLTASSSIYEQTISITSVDAATGSWSRSSLFTGSTVSRPDTVFANVPRTGYFHRPSATVTGSDGSSIVVNEFTSLRLAGTGLSPLVLTTPTGKLFELSLVGP